MIINNKDNIINIDDHACWLSAIGLACIVTV
jgi:hypothetical protein